MAESVKKILFLAISCIFKQKTAKKIQNLAQRKIRVLKKEKKMMF